MDSANLTKEDGGDKSEESSYIESPSNTKKLPYPKGVFFVLSIYFWERCSYYGVKSILILYLTNVLLFSEDKSTVVYHGWSTLSYFAPLFGALIADSFLGKFKTILYVSMLYATGNVILALAATPPIHIPTEAFSLMGLALIALGTGGMKPCVSSFGGDQFKLPEQAALLTQYFSFFYFAINSGTLISNIVAPIFRRDVACFGETTCYSLAFSVPAVLMVLVVVIFISGKSTYTIKEPTDNMMVKVAKCIAHGISRKLKSGARRNHWLDFADDMYDQNFIEDVKIFLRVLFLYIPLPVFWALWNQQGSRWTLQATRMDGMTFGVRIKPDQIQMSSAILILIFIPTFSYIIYPILTKLKLARKPLQRIVTGGILSGLAFVIAGIVELKLEADYPIKLRDGQSNLHFVNTLPFDIHLNLDGENNGTTLSPSGNFVFQAIQAKEYNVLEWHESQNASANFIIKAESEQAHTVLIGMDSHGKMEYFKPLLPDDRTKAKEGARVRFVAHFREDQIEEFALTLRGERNEYEFLPEETNWKNGLSTETKVVEPSMYKLYLTPKLQNNSSKEFQIGSSLEIKMGGSYIVAIGGNYSTSDSNQLNPSNYVVSTFEITKANSIHMFYLLPQYIVMTAGEIFYAITGLEFSYSQAPVSMKSLVQSAWLITVAFGNLIVVIIAGAKFFDEQSKEFFLFAGIMFIDMSVFAILAYRYIPAQHRTEDGQIKKLKG